jgi:hypothetical protein
MKKTILSFLLLSLCISGIHAMVDTTEISLMEKDPQPTAFKLLLGGALHWL